MRAISNHDRLRASHDDVRHGSIAQYILMLPHVSLCSRHLTTHSDGCFLLQLHLVMKIAWHAASGDATQPEGAVVCGDHDRKFK